MDASVYNRASHRALPRDEPCVVAELLGVLVDECHGVIERHHTDPNDPDSPTLPVCKRHHPKLQALVRYLSRRRKWRRCTHVHPYPGGREECERRLNRDLVPA